MLRSSNIDEDTFTFGEDDVFVDKGVVKSPKVKEGDILITAANGSSRLVGKHTIIKDLPENSAIHGGFMLLASCRNPEFINSLMSSAWYTKFINLYVAGGNGAIGNLNKHDLDEQNVLVPSQKEQSAIGTFFSTLDQQITLHQRKLDKLKSVKQAYLSEIFPAEGERVPKRRFPGFTDAWELRKLGEVAISFDYGLNSAATEYDGENKYLRITDIDDDSREFNISDLTSPEINLFGLDEYRLSIGDILFARTGASVGKSYIYRSVDGKVYFAGFLIRVKIKDTFNPDFVFQNTLTSNYERFISITSMRSGQPGVNAQEYSNYEIMFPSLPEQEVISTFFSTLDQQITLHQRKSI